MKWGILATGTIAKKFASTVEQIGAEGGSSLLPWGPDGGLESLCTAVQHPSLLWLL